jgi:hypothetical protein
VLRNKRTAYILLPITLIIWGLIGYKVYQYLTEGDEDVSLENTVVAPLKEKLSSDSFLVFNNYRDPFLGNDSKELVSSAKPSGHSVSYSNSNTHPNNPHTVKLPKNQQTAAVPPATDAWPKIVYQGSITNETTKQTMGFVSIDGVSTRVRPGDAISAGLKVIQFDQNAITIAKGKEKKVFTK